MARIEGVDPDRARGPIKAVFEAQTKKWGAPLLNHLLYARRPTIFRGARAMWAGLDSSGLIDAKLVSHQPAGRGHKRLRVLTELKRCRE